MNKCIECGRKISKKAKRCLKCNYYYILFNLYHKKCTVCGKTFKPNGITQKYCSEKCYETFIKQYQKSYAKKYRKLNKALLIKNSNTYYYKNRKKLLAYKKIYRKEKIKTILKSNSVYYKKQMKCNLQFKLRKNLRTRIWYTLKGLTKSKHTIQLLGCSVEQLKQHLESQFKPGMSWKNYGKWHIDHIKPCSSFDLSKFEEQRKCFNYKNLQPLWAIDNLRKGSKKC